VEVIRDFLTVTSDLPLNIEQVLLFIHLFIVLFIHLFIVLFIH